MHILVTNDDGVQAPGLLALAQEMRKLGKVTVFAPDRTPLAWAGRPSELPAERFSSTESYAFQTTALGPRLIYVKPAATNADRAESSV